MDYNLSYDLDYSKAWLTAIYENTKQKPDDFYWRQFKPNLPTQPGGEEQYE